MARAKVAGKPSTVRWHGVRAEGVMKRFDKVLDCCGREMWRELPCDHKPRKERQLKIELGCSDWRACVHCRGKRARSYRARFRDAREHALRRYRFARHGGRWGEKFLTFTVPHVGTVDERMVAIKATWPRFLRLLKEHLHRDIGVPRNMLGFDWLNVLETTPGTDRNGHPHFHVWFVLPFVHYAIVRWLWARAMPARYSAALPMKPMAEVLEEARGGARGRGQLTRWLVTRRGPNGRALEEVPWPVVDVRKARDVEHELIKYLVKDSELVDGSREFMPPAEFGRIYTAYASRRSISASRGFWLPPREPLHCKTCGVLWRTTGVYHRTDVGNRVGALFYALGAMARARERGGVESRP